MSNARVVSVSCVRTSRNHIGCTLVYPDGGVGFVDGNWPTIEEAEAACLEIANADRAAAIDETARDIQRAMGDKRRQQGRRLIDVARQIGVSISAISEWERGISEPSAEMFAAWVAALEGGSS